MIYSIVASSFVAAAALQSGPTLLRAPDALMRPAISMQIGTSGGASLMPGDNADDPGAANYGRRAAKFDTVSEQQQTRRPR